MMTPRPSHHQPTGKLLMLFGCILPTMAGAATPAQVANPIGRIARMFNSQLVQVEDRVQWLDRQISTYALHTEHPLKVGLGYRACRSNPSDPDPSITLDLGRELPIDTLFLVPAQREFLEDSGIFPKRFTIELSNRADFGQRTILFTSGSTPQAQPDGIPVSFDVSDSARYVRLTVQEGHNKGILDLFGLSEFVVISKGQPASFGAKVTSVGGLDAPGIWFNEALTDGRMPLGIWQNGVKPHINPGDSIPVTTDGATTTWTVDLKQDTAVDRVVIYPYQVNRSFEALVFPDSFEVLVHNGDDSKSVYQWTNPLPGSNNTTPLIIPLHGVNAGSVSVRALLPWEMGDMKIHAISEFEVWSGARNLAQGLPVTREHQGETTAIQSLTDNYTSEKKIIPVATWLSQLCERGRVEQELQSLRSVHRQLASRSELNATWGSAVILGLTFLIPVFIVERRRLMSKRQLDHIRKRIASDLHDDIGSNLGSISLIARTARKDLVRLEGPEEIAEDLGEVETIARESSLAMRDIVWLLERRQDSIGDLVQRMRETANRLLREVEFTLECESNKTASKLSLDAKRHLFLFYKEAVHNILKHSQATRVSIRLWDEDDKLALEVVDNGIGLPRGHDKQPAAVRKLEERARVLLGQLEVTSAPREGTRINLLVKRSNLTSQPSTAS